MKGRLLMIILVAVCVLPSTYAFSLGGGGNFMDAIVNVTQPLVGGPVTVGNETVDSIADGVNKLDEQYKEFQVESGQAGQNVDMEKQLREQRWETITLLSNRMYSLFVYTFKLVFDTILLAFLLAEMVLLVTLFTRWIPMLFRKLVDNTAQFVRRRII